MSDAHLMPPMPQCIGSLKKATVRRALAAAKRIAKQRLDADNRERAKNSRAVAIVLEAALRLRHVKGFERRQLPRERHTRVKSLFTIGKGWRDDPLARSARDGAVAGPDANGHPKGQERGHLKRQQSEILPAGALSLSALADNEMVLLGLEARDVRGFMAYEDTGGECPRRTYFDCSAGPPRRLPYGERPTHWRPLQPLPIAREEKPDADTVKAAVAAELAEYRATSSADDDECAVAGWQPKREPGVAGARGHPERQQKSETGGALEERAVRSRVERAIKTLIALRDPEWKFLSAGARINWPMTSDSYDDLKAQEENHDNKDDALRRRRAFQPTRTDIGQMDEGLAWFLALGTLSLAERAALIRRGREPLSDEQRLVWWHCKGFTARSIAVQTGEKHETVRRHINDAFRRLTAIANGGSGAKKPRGRP